MTKRVKHEIVAVALIYARCSCGWEFRIEKLKGKSDEDLALETGYAYTSHQASKEK